MRLLEFFNEAQEIELKSPGTLQKVLDDYLADAASRDELSPHEQNVEKRAAVIRSRLEQSKEAGLGKFGPSSGQYGKLALDQEDVSAVLHILQKVGKPEDVAKMKRDLQGMRFEDLEEISANGFEGNYGGDSEGFEVQNQGVTRRTPGEGPSVNGGRAQSQEMDSYDQPQYAPFPPPRRFQIMQSEEFDEAREVEPGFFVYRPGEEEPPIQPDPEPYQQELPLHDPKKRGPSPWAKVLYPGLFPDGWKEPDIDEEFMGVRDPESFETQDPHQGTQEAGPIAQHESLLREFFCLREGRKYKIRIEGDGQGSLVWDGEHEMLAVGNGDEMVRAVMQREPSFARSGMALRKSYDSAIKNGTDLIFNPHDGSIYEVDKEEV